MNQNYEESRGLDPAGDIRKGAIITQLFVSAWAITIYLPMRCGSGKEHTGGRAVLGMVFPFIFMLFVPDPSVALIWPYYLCGLLIHRYGHWRAYRRGEVEHTQYQGRPWLTQLLFRKASEKTAVMILEPLLAAVIGCALAHVGEGIALYFLFGGAAMFIKQLFVYRSSQRTLDQYNDAMIENGYLMSQSRGSRRFR
jgi:hypothetical protein